MELHITKKVAFDYNEDSIVNVRHENYGLITEGSADQPISDFANIPISTHANEQVSEFGRFANEDFGHISIDPEQSINTHGYNHDDYGFIGDTNRFPFGGFTFDDGSVTSATSKFQVKLPVEGPVFQIRGAGEIYVLPVHIGTGITRLGGDATIRIRAVYYGSGTAFSFVSGAEVTCSVPPTEAPLLDFNGTARERFGKGNYDASGTFSTFSGAAESTVISSKPQVLFDVNGTALEKHTENYVGTWFPLWICFFYRIHCHRQCSIWTIQVPRWSNREEHRELCWYWFSVYIRQFYRSNGSSQHHIWTLQVHWCSNQCSCQIPPTWYWFLFGFNGGAESVTFDYNCHSSIVNIGADNYGFVTESVVDQTITDYANVPISTYANEVVSDFGLDPRQESFGHISIDPEQSINTHGIIMRIMDSLLNLKVVISSHVSTSILVEQDSQKPEHEVMLVLVHSLHSLVLQKLLLLKPTIPSDYSRFMVLVVLLLPYPMLVLVKSILVTLELISLLRSSSPHQPLVFYSSSLVDWMSVVSEDHPTSRQHLRKLDMQNSALLEMHLLPSILDILEVVNSISMAMLSRSIPKHTLSSGSLFAFTGGAESFTRDIPETATLFRFAGNGIEKNTENYVGRGALFGFVSKTESTTSAEQPKVLFNIEGASVLESIPLS